ncbi:NAD(P)H-dependent oxidoreductase [Streptomyces cinnamoneus]|uniref:NAD(P)H-dependent oxidoreductase n=1 Tax=Streptomyces cinnamoneus TaxID=53446 RepID=A0A2G1XNL0_STRCJ|nr:NADPH-dependent FMN reductase [Streptomyces cinnamoneus]PHQ52803.1 NAD(P)H-dependent oxidoreductase [Streptomyces cinnamoneus]PPT11905.1 NAD(P)H-dependent oxidoreductase [Streptomyces cinnamoneus]
MKIVTLSGSLRARSANAAVLRTALDVSGAPARAAEIGALPHFNPDDDGEGAVPPPPVAALRSAVADADAVLIVSPEYARGVPGVLKNALDWLVSSGEFVGKPVAVITASPMPAGGDQANTQLCGTLAMMTAEVVAEACLCVGLVAAKLDGTADRVTDEPTVEALTAAMAALRKAVPGAA